MPRVFVPEPRQLAEPRAKRFGQIVPLVPATARLGLEPDRIKYIMARPLATFEDDDFLLLDGANIHCAVASSVIAIQRNSMNLLLWDSGSQQYLLRQLTLEELPQAKDIVSEKRVFLANDTHSHGDLGMTSVALTTGMDPDVMEPEKLKEKMTKILGNSQSQDYLMTSGAKSHNVVASAILSRMHEQVNYMLWNARRKEYERRTVFFSLDDLQQILGA